MEIFDSAVEIGGGAVRAGGVAAEFMRSSAGRDEEPLKGGLPAEEHRKECLCHAGWGL